MPNRNPSIRVIIFYIAIFGCFSAKAATVYTETFASGSNGWHWIPPSALWQTSLTGGYASVTVSPFTGSFPPLFNRAVLSSTNTAIVSGGAFTGNYSTAKISRIGFKYWASSFSYNDALASNPTQITSKVTIRWGNNAHNYVRQFRPAATGIWYSFEADLRCYDEGGWSGSSASSATNFHATLEHVEFVQIEVEGQGSASFGGTVNTYLIDDLFIDTLTNYTTSMSSQTITFPSIPEQLTNGVLHLSATASSGLPVYFSVLSGPAVIGCCTSVTFTGTGVVSIVASQNGDTNYNAAASVTQTFTVKAPASVQLQNMAQTYDGSARIATATTIPPGLAVTLTYDGSATPPTNAGSYAIVATIDDPSYAGLATGTLVVAKATATISLSGLDAIYDGSSHCVTASTLPTGLSFEVTYDGLTGCPTHPGSYLVVGAVSDSNYVGAVTNTMQIAKLEATVLLAGLTSTYNGLAQCVSATTTPTGLVVNITYDGLSSCPVNAGLYTVIGQIDDPIYIGSITQTLTISKATGTVSFSNLTNTYTGDAYCAQALSSPPGRRVNITYNGQTDCPVHAGDYVVVGTIDNANYEGVGTNIMTIRKASQSVTFSALPVFVDGDVPYTMNASSDAGLPVSFASSDPAVASVSGNTLYIVGPGSADITASQAGNTNYAAATDAIRTAVVNNLVIELDAKRAGTNLLLDITGNAGRAYFVEQTSDLNATNWQTFLFIPSLPSPTYQVSDPATNAQRYYRLKRFIWSP